MPNLSSSLLVLNLCFFWRSVRS